MKFNKLKNLLDAQQDISYHILCQVLVAALALNHFLTLSTKNEFLQFQPSDSGL